jgi:hypothetical protein
MHAYTLAAFTALAFPAATVVPQVRLVSPCPPMPEPCPKIAKEEGKKQLNTNLDPNNMQLRTT